jgi:serine/threonine protein kinase
MSDPPSPTRTDSPVAGASAPATDQVSSAVIDRFTGSILSHYQLEEPVGRGGIGVVYRAKDIKLGRSVAIKLLSRTFSTSDDARARFLREARAASALDHPNIATILEFGEQDGEQFIAMPLYGGETLKQPSHRSRQ